MINFLYFDIHSTCVCVGTYEYIYIVCVYCVFMEYTYIVYIVYIGII